MNVRGPYFIIERALPLLRDGGRIIRHTRVGDVLRLGYAHDGTAFQRGAHTAG